MLPSAALSSINQSARAIEVMALSGVTLVPRRRIPNWNDAVSAPHPRAQISGSPTLASRHASA
jgi:hypothetical protein